MVEKRELLIAHHGGRKCFDGTPDVHEFYGCFFVVCGS